MPTAQSQQGRLLFAGVFLLSLPLTLFAVALVFDATFWLCEEQCSATTEFALLPVLLFTAAAFSFLLARYARHRLARRFERCSGQACVHCGYDLTGNTSGVCPECGELVQR